MIIEWGIIMYKAIEFSQYVINWCNNHSIVITNLKLQKLLYFLQGEFCSSTGKRLLQDDFYAWQLGPVIPNVYNSFAMYSSFPLPSRKTDISIDDKYKNQIDRILSRYAYKSTWDLVDLSHSQDPWKYNYQIFGDKSLIPYQTIERFFTGVNNNG